MNKIKTFRTLLVDDERPARKGLRILLDPYPQVEIIGEAGSVSEAVKLIETVKPDLLFLDIQMPGQSGFELLERVNADFSTIFVTAYDEYAIRALKMNALDYLLKPVSHEAIKKSLSLLLGEIPSEQKKSVLFGYDDRIFLKADHAYHLVKLKNIVAINAEGDYSRITIHPDQKLLVLKTLKEWENILPKTYFIRVHRSTIVNLEFIVKIEKGFNDSFFIFLRNFKEPLTLTQSYISQLKEIAPFIK